MLSHIGTETIETPRLILRKAGLADAHPMFRNWASDPEVTKYLTWPTYQREETANQILEFWEGEYERQDFYHWMIVLKELAEPIGSISVVNLQEATGEMEVGYCIGRSWWHKGIVPEALAAVMEYLFVKAGAKRITAKHDTNNPRSGGVMGKCGMRCEGTTYGTGKNNQGICDITHYGICREDWEASRK